MDIDQEQDRYSPNPHFNVFIVTVLDVFASLAEFGFSLDSYGDFSYECVVGFKNATTGILVYYEMPSQLSVALAKLDSNGRISQNAYGLVYLIQERCPDYLISQTMSNSDPDTGFRELLELYATIIREHAVDVMAGDFSVFPILKQRVRDQINKNKREETAKNKAKGTKRSKGG